MTLSLFFSRTWWKTTLLVIVAVAVMIRLGIWQLDRLEQRRAFNARVQAQMDQPVLDLNLASLSAAPSQNLSGMEYRDVEVTGEYDQSGEVVLRNQVWENESGVNLLTPLKIDGSDQAVLVNRGWVPFEEYTAGRLGQYNEPGIVKIKGVIRASQSKPDIGGQIDPVPAPGEPKLLAWNMVNVQGIGSQLPYQLLPVYIQAYPDPSWTTLPYRSQVDLELTEGPHMGYAIQWFIFATILGVGYPFYIRKESSAPKTGKSNSSPYIQNEKIESNPVDNKSKGHI